MEVEIARPSPAQMRKLHMRQPFRAMMGSGLKIHVPIPVGKKLMKASMKGMGSTIHGGMCCGCGMCGDGIPPQFDPRNQPQSSSGQARMGGNVKATAKDSAKRLMVAGTDRAVRALDGSGMNPFVKVQRQLDKKRIQEKKAENQAQKQAEHVMKQELMG